VAGGDRCLELIGTGSSSAQGLLDELLTRRDLVPIPARPILLLQGDRHPVVILPSASTSVGQQQECQQALDLGLAGQRRMKLTR
jgi:hypothetical protein